MSFCRTHRTVTDMKIALTLKRLWKVMGRLSIWILFGSVVNSAETAKRIEVFFWNLGYLRSE